jgi:hypothetical protein
MAEQDYHPARLFTIEQANAMLPLVRAITADLSRVAKDVIERRNRLHLLTAGRQLKVGDPYADELAQMESEIEKDALRLQEYVGELRDLGVEPKGAIDGLIDFPALIDGQLVFLCWRLGEPEVTHWHAIEAGFAGRQSLVAGSLAGADDSDDDTFRN